MYSWMYFEAFQQYAKFNWPVLLAIFKKFFQQANHYVSPVIENHFFNIKKVL